MVCGRTELEGGIMRLLTLIIVRLLGRTVTSVQCRSFQVHMATPRFCNPKIWELVKHKNDRHVPGEVKSPLLALCEEPGR